MNDGDFEFIRVNADSAFKYRANHRLKDSGVFSEEAFLREKGKILVEK